MAAETKDFLLIPFSSAYSSNFSLISSSTSTLAKSIHLEGYIAVNLINLIASDSNYFDKDMLVDVLESGCIQADGNSLDCI